MSTRRCPRCHESYDERMSAGSRAVPERDIDVCGPCGSDEAGYDYNGGPLPSMADWPVRRKYGPGLQPLGD